MSDDGERLGRLVAELGRKVSYASGSRPFPEPITDDDAVAIAEAFAAEVDAGTAARARQAEAQGYRIACGSGCDHCCQTLVSVYRPEALVVARWLRRPENAAARAVFSRAYPAWRSAVGDVAERTAAAEVARDVAGAEALHREHYQRRILCAFDEAGRCLIYPVRPLGCRNAHALDTSDRCRGDDPARETVAALSFVPLDRLMRQSSQLLCAAHNAMAPAAVRHRRESLCVLVARLLDEEA